MIHKWIDSVVASSSPKARRWKQRHFQPISKKHRRQTGNVKGFFFKYIILITFLLPSPSTTPFLFLFLLLLKTLSCSKLFNPLGFTLFFSITSVMFPDPYHKNYYLKCILI